MHSKVVSRLSSARKKIEDALDLIVEASHECLKGDEENSLIAEKIFSNARSLSIVIKSISTFVDSVGSDSATIESATIVQPEFKNFAKAPRKRKDDYPRYGRRAETLVKLGLGRDKLTEYEHTVPKNQIDAIIEKLRIMRSTKKDFRAEVLQRELECPSYQTYIVLALLKHLDVLDIQRRGTYVFKNQLPSSSDLWERIPALD